MANQLALRVENIERDFVFRRALEIIIDHGTSRGIVADRLTFIELCRIMEAKRDLRLIQQKIGLGGIGAHLPQRRQVIQHPKGTSMSGDDEVIIFHH